MLTAAILVSCGVEDFRYLFGYAYMNKGDSITKELVKEHYLDELTVGEYSMKVTFEYTTKEMYFAEEYQNTPSDVYPTDKQISDGGDTYRITVEVPLTVVE